MFQKYISSYQQNMISSICDLVTFPSVSIESNSSYFPFGKACSDSLKYFLNLASSLGFRTKNIDGYCGFAEFGEGSELIGIIGHLDVVPAKEKDWSYSPFIPTIDHNCIYGRGTIDDKGPVISCLYAMKSVMDYAKENSISFTKRVRLIVGLNEEKDWKCMKYYKEKEEIPTISFSPDADFPCIYAEKAVLSLVLTQEIPPFLTSNSASYSSLSIEEIDCHQNPINVVPKFCSVILKIAKGKQIKDLITSCKKRIDQYSYEIDLYKIDDSHLKLTSYGCASHSAHPELGVNAISKLIVVLSDLFTEWNSPFPLLHDFSAFIGDDFTGKNLGLQIQDESGALTLNTSQFYIEKNKICIGINLRIPVHTNVHDVLSIFETKFKNNVSVLAILPALSMPKDHPLVQKLCHIFNETCHTHLEPIAIGGATYARAFPNCVSFGMNFPGDIDLCHQVDECIQIDKLMLATNIYAKAIWELLQLDI